MPKRARSRVRTPRRRPLPSPPTTVARRMSPGDVSMRSRSSSFAGTVARGTGRVAARVLRAYRNPYVQGGLMAASYGRRLYQRLRPMMKRKRKMKGASDSKSAGFISNNGKKVSKIESFMDKGVVQSVEQGNVTSSLRDVSYIAHSTNPRMTTLRVVIGALVKKLFNKAGIKIKNWDWDMLDGVNIPARVEIVYKERDGGARQRAPFTIPTNKTLRQLVTDIENWILGFTPGNYPQQFLELQYFHDIGTIGSSRLIAYEIDLQSVKIHMYAKSHLKIQNRTVNQAINDQADDVDNVPLYGRHFTVVGNGSMFRDYPDGGATSPYLTTDRIYGVLDYSVTAVDSNTTMYKEVPYASQFTGVKETGSIHLDPGQVKTSILVNEQTISWNAFIQRFYGKAGNGVANNDSQRFAFGKTKIIAMEKMIQAVATTAENSPKIAYEHNLEVAAYVTIYQNLQTAKSVSTNTGAIVAA